MWHLFYFRSACTMIGFSSLGAASAGDLTTSLATSGGRLYLLISNGTWHWSLPDICTIPYLWRTHKVTQVSSYSKRYPKQFSLFYSVTVNHSSPPPPPPPPSISFLQSQCKFLSAIIFYISHPKFWTLLCSEFNDFILYSY
jgi:hypothetical protein